MPDHVYVLVTPKTTLEKAVQFIKGGFSYRARKELGSNLEIWQKGFSDHRIRDAQDYRLYQVYIQQNPVRKNLCARAEDYVCPSAHSEFDLDPVPRGLKPGSSEEPDTARLEGAPFQTETDDKGVRFFGMMPSIEAHPFTARSLPQRTHLKFAYWGLVLTDNRPLATDNWF